MLNVAPSGRRCSEIRYPELRLSTACKQHVMIVDLKILRENLLGGPGAMARSRPLARPVPTAIIDFCRRVDARRNVIGSDPANAFIRTNAQNAVTGAHNAEEVGRRWCRCALVHIPLRICGRLEEKFTIAISCRCNVSRIVPRILYKTYMISRSNACYGTGRCVTYYWQEASVVHPYGQYQS